MSERSGRSCQWVFLVERNNGQEHQQQDDGLNGVERVVQFSHYVKFVHIVCAASTK